MAKCEICGKSVTMALIRYRVPDQYGRGHDICKDCRAKVIESGKVCKWDSKAGKIILTEKENLDICKRCRVCGHVFCYTNFDIMKNREQQNSAKLDAIASFGNALAGNYAASAVNSGNADNAMNRIVDYSKCPHCGSRDLEEIDKQEYIREQKSKNEKQTVNAVSPADELKKFKELLDAGILTDAEFESKKKQLLGL